MGEELKKWKKIIGGCCLISLMLAMSIAAHAKIASEKDWPRQIEVPKGTIVIYQPQMEMFNGINLKGRCAICVTPKGAAEPSWGALWFEARVLVDRDLRLASILEIKIPRARFAGSTPEQEKRLTAFIEEEVPKWNLSISLDRLLAGLNVSGREIMAQERFDNTPPRIIVSEEPAVLISIIGGAKLIKIENTNLMRVANSIFQILFDPANNIYSLNGGSVWFAAQNLQADWIPVDRVPEELMKFYTVGTQPEAKSNSGAAMADDKLPRIIISSEPAELIVFNGPPKFLPIAGTDLFYASNTESDVFIDGMSRQIFVLLAGRWFKAASLAGPWQYVPADVLPGGFDRIPADSLRGRVLAHVAGTETAQEAVLNTQIPQTALISRRKARLQVTYDGEPVFKQIEGLGMQYAVNTEFAIISTGGRYYCCHHAIWYESERPSGPWKVCISVPDIIYSMPPSCPLYHVKYVRVYQVTPENVQVGYTPGYVGCYIASAGTVVYGTGYSYPEWFQKQYIARPITWGLRAHYNPLTGAWGLRADYISPGGRCKIIPGSVDGGGHRITKWSMAGWWGAGGYRDYLDMPAGERMADATHFRNDERAKHSIYAKYEASAEAESIQRHVENVRFAEMKKVIVPKANPNNVFVDRLGDVYRRTENGWQKKQGSDWMKVGMAKEENKTQLNAEYRKRQRGIERDRQNGAAEN